MTQLAYRWTLIVFAFFIAGCGGGRAVYPVQGTVKFKDGRDITPLVGGLVEFESMDEKLIDRVTAKGTIQADGSFSLSTYGLGEGAVEGKHRAVVFPHASDDSETPSQPVIDSRFQTYDRSGLEFNVTRDKNENQFVLEVEPPRKRR